MTDTADERDMPMEEILASIRNIIAEDDPTKKGRKKMAAQQKMPKEDVLELTDIVVAPEESVAPAFPLPPEPSKPKKKSAPVTASPLTTPLASGPETLISPSTQESTIAAFANLVAAAQVQNHSPVRGDAGSLRVDELVADAVKPLLKAWLDTHLPGIVERAVALEIRKLTDKFRL